MTYQELITELQKLTKDQLDCNLTVEMLSDHGSSDYIQKAELAICNEEHGVLDDGHPVILVGVC